MAAHVYLRMRAARRARPCPPSTAGFARRGSERATEGRAAHSTGRTTDFARAPRTPRRPVRRAAHPPPGSSHAPQPPRPLPPSGSSADPSAGGVALWPAGAGGRSRHRGVASPRHRAALQPPRPRAEGGFGRAQTVRFDVSARALLSILFQYPTGEYISKTRADLTVGPPLQVIIIFTTCMHTCVCVCMRAHERARASHTARVVERPHLTRRCPACVRARGRAGAPSPPRSTLDEPPPPIRGTVPSHRNSCHRLNRL